MRPDSDVAADTIENREFAAFFCDVNAIKDDIDKAKQLLSKLQAEHEEGKTIHVAFAMKALQAKMDRDVADVLQKAKAIKVNLEDLDKANLMNRSHQGCELGTPIDRTRTSITNSLEEKLKNLMDEFQLLRHRIAAEHRETVERRYHMVMGERADEHTVERMIETGEIDAFLHKAIQKQGLGGGENDIMDAVQELQERHNDIRQCIPKYRAIGGHGVMIITPGPHLARYMVAPLLKFMMLSEFAKCE